MSYHDNWSTEDHKNHGGCDHMHQNFRTRLSSSPVCSTNPVKLKTCRPGRRRSWMRPRRYTCLIPEPARLGSVLKAHRVRMTSSRYPSVEPTRAFTQSSPTSSDTFPQCCSWIRLSCAVGRELKSVLVWLLMLLPPWCYLPENVQCQCQLVLWFICLTVDI